MVEKQGAKMDAALAQNPAGTGSGDVVGNGWKTDAFTMCVDILF